MKLYEYPQSRSTRVQWVLAELGLEYESITVDLKQGEQFDGGFLSINPYGKVPVLVDGDAVITESAAICTWLAEKYPDHELIPPAGSVERGHYYQWTIFCMAELEPFLWSMRKHMLLYPKQMRSRAAVELAKQEYRDNVQCLARHIDEEGYVVGGAFGAADIIVGYNLLWAETLRLLDTTPALPEYLQRLKQRPAFPRQFV